MNTVKFRPGKAYRTSEIAGITGVRSVTVINWIVRGLKNKYGQNVKLKAEKIGQWKIWGEDINQFILLIKPRLKRRKRRK